MAQYSSACRCYALVYIEREHSYSEGWQEQNWFVLASEFFVKTFIIADVVVVRLGSLILVKKQ